MANSNNTQLSASETESAKRAANDAAYGALLVAAKPAPPTIMSTAMTEIMIFVFFFMQSHSVPDSS